LFEGSAEKEKTLRYQITSEYEVFPFWAEGMLNSVDEGLKLLKLILTRGIRAEHTVIVTGQSHSRFVRWLYGLLLVGCKITVICVPFETEYQADHRAKMQRTAWRWLVATFERHLAFAFLGRRIAKIHHSVD
jgi:non-ribosomal peptide synthetase component F